MLLELVSILICLWVAVKLRQWQPVGEDKQTPWTLAKRSLRWGAVAVTVPMLGYFGVVRYMHGLGIPSVFVFTLATGLTALVMIGAEVELTGNILIDYLLVSAGLAAGVFTIFNGLPVAWGLVNAANMCRWSLLCVGAALPVRVSLWIVKGI